MSTEEEQYGVYYVNKEDIQVTMNYIVINLCNHNMKSWERLNEHKLKCNSKVLGNQFGCKARSIIQTIYFLRD